jgi:hypothetical protein
VLCEQLPGVWAALADGELDLAAGGRRFVLTEHGVLRVTTPGGITRTTRPPGLHDRIEQRALPPPAPPPALPEEPPPF